MTLGDTTFEWRPDRWIEPFYWLLPDHMEAYQSFLVRAAEPVVWAPIHRLQPIGTESLVVEAPPDDEIEWWARRADGLWVVADRFWNVWPDPLRHSLYILPQGGSQFIDAGQFQRMPTAWEFPEET